MDEDMRNGVVTFVAVVAAAFVTLAFRQVLYTYLGLAWVLPMVVAPFIAPRCGHTQRFLHRGRLYGLAGALIGYALYAPLIIALSPFHLGFAVWTSISISVIAAASLAARFSMKGCRRYAEGNRD